MKPDLRLGPPITYAPVCILHWHGFSGGPVGYQLVDRCAGPIIVERLADGHYRGPAPGPGDAEPREGHVVP